MATAAYFTEAERHILPSFILEEAEDNHNNYSEPEPEISNHPRRYSITTKSGQVIEIESREQSPISEISIQNSEKTEQDGDVFDDNTQEDEDAGSLHETEDVEIHIEDTHRTVDTTASERKKTIRFSTPNENEGDGRKDEMDSEMGDSFFLDDANLSDSDLYDTDLEDEPGKSIMSTIHVYDFNKCMYWLLTK